MKHLVLLNGPPRSGKDFAAKHLAREFAFQHVSLASCLKTMVHAAYGIMGLDGKPARYDYFEGTKDEPCPALYDLTPREAYIAFSEHYIKPIHGSDFFGRRLAERIQHSEFVVVSDSGFVQECEALVALTCPDKTTLIHLERDGHGFDSDSRGYVDIIGSPIERHVVRNSGRLGFLHEIERAVGL